MSFFYSRGGGGTVPPDPPRLYATINVHVFLSKVRSTMCEISIFLFVVIQKKKNNHEVLWTFYFRSFLMHDILLFKCVNQSPIILYCHLFNTLFYRKPSIVLDCIDYHMIAVSPTIRNLIVHNIHTICIGANSPHTYLFFGGGLKSHHLFIENCIIF